MLTARPLLLLAGCGALATATPALSAALPAETAPAAAATTQPQALALLGTATRTSRSRSWSGIQQVTSWRAGTVRTAVLNVLHDPVTGSVVTDRADGAAVRVPADVLDEGLVRLLADRYRLSVAGVQGCGGRAALLVEARRPGAGGAAGLAGRFWVDQRTGMVLRRDLLDATGRVVSRSTLTHLQVDSPSTFAPVSATVPTGAAHPVVPLAPSGRRVTASELAALAPGAPPELPGGLQLFDARRHDDRVLQLSYSDGLSTLSLFVQPGALPGAVTALPIERRGGADVRAMPGPSDRLAWASDGRTWSLVSDAPIGVVDAAVAVLPHAPVGRRGDALAARAWRGMSRIGGWLNPFD